MPDPNDRPSYLGFVFLIGALGGLIGFVSRSKLNQNEVIGFGNIPDQLIKLMVWSLMGTIIGSGVGYGIRVLLRATDDGK